MSDAQQWFTQRRIADKDVAGWRTQARVLMEAFGAELHGMERDLIYAPEMPPLRDGLEGFVSQPYRALMTWIPDWSMNIDAGHFVIRVDTCGRPRLQSPSPVSDTKSCTT